MSIRTKIFGVISIFLALACGLTAYGVYIIGASSDLVVELYDGPLMGINHARAAHAELGQALLVLQQSQSVEASTDAAKKFEKLVQDIAADLKVTSDRIQSPSVRPAQEKAETKVRQWSAAALATLKPTQAGLTELPANFTVVKLGQDAAAAVDDLVEDVAAYGFEFRTTAESNVVSARRTLIISSSAGLLLGLLLALVLAYSMSKPIKVLAKSMLELAGGDFNIVLPGVARSDEIGLVARAVEKFRVLAEKRAQDEANSKMSQDLIVARRRKAEMARIADDFETVVGEIVKTVSLTSDELESSASTLTDTAEKGMQLASKVATASGQASNNVQSVASATEELSSSVNEISRQVQQSARIAGEAVDQARGTTERVSELSKSAARIGDVVELINTIAGQTNLLALNATIEAARAGQAGRGFAVVASEVKALAEQTARATGEIGQQISGIQLATHESVEAIREISGTIERLAEVSSSIAAAVRQQGEATVEISRNVQHAALDTQHVSSNVIDVEHGAAETGAASSKVLVAAQALSGDSHRLRLEVDKFLATVRAA